MRFTPTLGVIACVTAYLYGSLPFVYLLAKAKHIDLKEVGSGNVGGTNLWATTGPLRGIVGGLADASKGVIPVAVCRVAGLPLEIVVLAGVCGTAGQCWPVWLGFNGGRGKSAFLGASLMQSPLAWAVALVPMMVGALWRIVPLLWRRRSSLGGLTGALWSKEAALGSLIGFLIFPLAYMGVSPPSALPATASSLLFPILLVVRRLTAPMPDEATAGPAVKRKALLFRLLYDRNTSQ